MTVSNLVASVLILINFTIEIAGYNIPKIDELPSRKHSIILLPSTRDAPITFRCTNGQYMNQNLFCGQDVYRMDDSREYTNSLCQDGSHESFGCDPEKCGRGRFKCNNGPCVGMDTRCNTKNDCSDGSDELNCGDEVNVGNCSLADGKFLCHDGLRCLDLEYTCNEECNCFDCSDENTNCTVKSYGEIITKCPHYYFATPNGPKCFCDSNDDELKNLCKEVKPCSNDNSDMCSQKCSQYKNKIICSCYEEFIPEYTENDLECISKAYYNNLLVYSTSDQMKVVNLTSGQNTVVMKSEQFAVVAGAHDHVYYTTFDDDRKTINRVSISTREVTRLFKSNSSIVSIAVDYITNNVYLTTNASLWVCSAEKKRCLELKCCNVRYVALAPKSGLMFYMKKADFQDECYIMKSAMDGSNEKYLVDGGFRHFSPLAVDELTRKIYWAQSEENEIWCLSFDDAHNNYKMLSSVKYQGVLLHFTVLDSQLLFTKLRDNEIYKIDKVERYTEIIKNYKKNESYRSYSSGFLDKSARIPSMMSWLRLGASRVAVEDLSTYYFDNATLLIDYNVTFAIKYLHAYNPTFQNTTKNTCAKASCNGLCFISFSNFAGYICKDTEGQTRSGDHAVWRDGISTAVEYSSSGRESEPNESSEYSEYNWSFLMTGFVVVVLGVVVLGAYFKFSRGSWFGYGNGLPISTANQGNVNDQVRIFSQMEL